MKSWRPTVLIPVSFAILFLVGVYVAKQASPNRDNAKLKELQQLAADVPQYSALMPVTTTSSSRFLDAGVYNFYTSAAAYDDVKAFYFGNLALRGFTLQSEESRQSGSDDTPKKLTFRKGDLRVVIEFAGVSSHGSWNYAVDFLWR
jgi:hypothetical protein